MHVTSRGTQTKTGGEISYISMDIIKDHPHSGSACPLSHCPAASRHSFPAFSLEKPKSWATNTVVKLQKMLTKRYCAATTVVIPCYIKDGQLRSAINIKKMSIERIPEPQIRQKEFTKQGMSLKVLRQFDRRQSSKALVSQDTIFQTASRHSGSSSLKTSEASQLEIQRSAACIMKKNRHLNLEKSLLKQLSLKAASSADDDDDDDDDDGGFVDWSVSSENKKSINRPQYKLRATQEDNSGDFSGGIITRQAELWRSDGESQTGQTHRNSIGSGNWKTLAFIPQTDATHTTDNNDVDHKHVLTEVGEQALIMLLLPDTEMETQTEPLSETKLILKTDTRWETVNIHKKEPADPQPMTKVMKENVITEDDNSKCKCLKEAPFPLGIHAIQRREGIDMKPAESIASVTKASASAKKQVKERTEEVEHAETDNTTHENMSRNHWKQEQDVAPGESVAPSRKMMETEKTVREHTAQTTALNMAIKQTTSSFQVFKQGSPQKTNRLPSREETPTNTLRPEPETDGAPRFITCRTSNTESTTGESFSGLRMREDVPAARGGPEDEEGDAVNRPETGREEDKTDPGGGTSFTFTKTLETIHKHLTNNLPKLTGDTVPLCRGLIHRTEAGWKHCTERFAGTGSKMISSRESMDAFERVVELEREHASVRDHGDSQPDDDDDDGHNHFYYFDGVLKRVKNSFHFKSRRRRKRSHDKIISSLRKKRDSSENLLSYIQRLTLRNQVSHFKWSGTDSHVQRGAHETLEIKSDSQSELST
ncbi:uncharacterized protein LOC118284769 isoform X2 [Scophthalmus maximus]|nr:uncharacterized protein LOC118284769 isoform X2 [Scophthalmus maximus]